MAQAIATKGRMCRNPDRLRPELEAADQRDAVGHKRDDRDRADEIADRAGNPQAHLQRGRQDHRLDREEDEGEGGVDQRRHGRADIAEAGTSGQEVDVDAAFGGMIGNRHAAAEDDGGDDEDRGRGVGDAVIEGDGAADRLEHQEGDRADRGVGDTGGGPSPRALGGEAQRVVFQRLVGNPLVVLAPDAVYSLPPCHSLPHSRYGPGALANPVPKAYVGILRCSIRDLAYACAAQIRAILTAPIACPRTKVGCSCQTKQTRACCRRSGVNY
ncbi:hypothetical protein ACVIW2_005238 [Bradyrhizobium huanghuaihaiense]